VRGLLVEKRCRVEGEERVLARGREKGRRRVQRSCEKGARERIPLREKLIGVSVRQEGKGEGETLLSSCAEGKKRNLLLGTGREKGKEPIYLLIGRRGRRERWPKAVTLADEEEDAP